MTRATFDPYAELGVPRGASQQQVQQAYRALARRYHPDMQHGHDSTQRMQRVNRAWEILSDPRRRASYESGSMADQGRPGQWTTSWANTASASAPAYSSEAAYDDGYGSGVADLVLIVVFVLFGFVALLAGFLPFPLAGIALLVFLRALFGRPG